MTSRGGANLRIAVVAGVRLYREGLSELLAQRVDIDVVCSSSPHEGIGAELLATQPDVALIDSETVANSPTCSRIAQAGASVKIVAFGLKEEDEDEILACARAGVCGFVSSDASLEQLLAVLRNASEEHAGCSPKVAAVLLRSVAAFRPVRKSSVELSSLTQREQQVLGCIEAGMSNKEIASKLGIAVITVKNHIHNLLGKLAVQRRGEAAAVLRSGGGLPVRASARGI